MNKKEQYIKLCNEGAHPDKIREVLKTTDIHYYKKLTKVNWINIRRSLNPNYFEDITTEYKAYFLGFIYADGYIQTNNRALEFHINKKDKYILEILRQELDSKANFIKSSTPNCTKMSFSSQELVNNLKKYNIVQCKSKLLYMPKLCKEMMPHFIRGYFDGDGHINKRQAALVISSKKMYEDFQDLMLNVFGQEVYHQFINNSYYRLQFNRRDADIIKWIYKDASIYLDRKYNVYLEHWHNYIPKGKELQDKKLVG